MPQTQKKKIADLKVKLADYESKLKREMIGYRGVIHESAASEIKHSKVMVYTDMVRSLREEIAKLEQDG